tara:strand:- start:5202 stop:6635 length:1434 start_codon:yes stop_codon:yes gene_type:complete
MANVTPAIQEIINSKDLPVRLKEELFSTFQDLEKVTKTQAKSIADEVELVYLRSRVEPLEPVGTVSAQSIGEPGTQMTMNTFHYAGVAEIDVTQGLPRLIELVDARRNPKTPTMTIYLEDEYAQDQEKAYSVVWEIESSPLIALGTISTDLVEMHLKLSLNKQTLISRGMKPEHIAATIGEKLDVTITRKGHKIIVAPNTATFRELLQLVSTLRTLVFKGIESIDRVVLRKETLEKEEGEYVLYTEGSALEKVLKIEGVDATRTTTNNVHEINQTLGIEAAREAIINETKDTLDGQGLDDVNVRHLMLVADMMTHSGSIKSIGRHGVSGTKGSVLARAAFEVTVNHLIEAAVYGERDDLHGVTENVIVGKPIRLGTGDVQLRMNHGSHVPPGLKKKTKPKSIPKTKPATESPSTEEPIFNLTDLPGVGPKKAEILSEAGFNTIESLSEATEDDLCALSGISASYAQQLKSTIETLLK